MTSVVYAREAEPGVTQDNLVPGTPHYMPPESLRAPDRVDARGDIYALGATSYFLLTGAPVFEGTLNEVFTKHLTELPVAPSKRSSGLVTPSLDALILAALAKRPEERPQSVRAFEAALAACADVLPWSAAEAAAWWKDRGQRIKAARSGAPAPGVSSPTTLVIGRA